ncbi:MAG: phenylalanine--tRNA ligase subunit beta [Verrucomicrobiota bacterium]
MKFSLNWLNDHIDLSSYSTGELSDLLTFAGVEVEGIEEKGGNIESVVVGRIEASDPHPDAERLSVCKVDDGSGESRQIVCGAKNYKVGDRVPVALPGAELPGGFKIKKSKLRGVPSEGMMCSGRELGLSDDHEGLLILSDEPATGTPIGDLFESDTLFDVEITPNRPDLLSHFGMARELAAITGKPLKNESPFKAATGKRRSAGKEEVELIDTDRCPFYTARTIRDIKVKESPEWLRTKLEAVGLRPINNIVDITNFVLLETGQPLHAFDLDRLNGGIRVRGASEGETFVALDGQTYQLDPRDLVIADQEESVALAGVMGGEESGVEEGTSNILLESAYFQPSSVRRTSRILNLSSDSSYRFERGIDPHQTIAASELATQLILELAGGEADEALLAAGTEPQSPGEVTLDLAQTRSFLGAPNLTNDRMLEILERLQLVKTKAERDSVTLAVPTFRLDLARPIDLIEEIARIHGLDRVPARQQAVLPGSSKVDSDYDRLMQLRSQLAGQGLFEAQTIKLIADRQLDDDFFGLRTSGQSEPVALKNPISDDHTLLRPSLLPGLLGCAERNRRMGSERLAFFEIGTVFSKHAKSPRVLESRQLGIVLGGQRSAPSWHHGEENACDFHDLRGLLEDLFRQQGLTLNLRPTANSTLPLDAEITAGKTVIGRAGVIPPGRTRDMDFNAPLFAAEIDLTKLLRAGGGTRQVSGLPKFPPITRDVAIEAALDLPNADLASFFETQCKKEPLLVEAALFDVFTDPSGEKLAADRKSVAYSLTYRSSDKTLTTEEADSAHQNVLKRLQKQLEIQIR